MGRPRCVQLLSGGEVDGRHLVREPLVLEQGLLVGADRHVVRLFMLIDGRNIFLVISQVDASQVVIEPGLSLPADFSNWVSTKNSPTPARRAWSAG